MINYHFYIIRGAVKVLTWERLMLNNKESLLTRFYIASPG
jgi:hypothetical protein